MAAPKNDNIQNQILNTTASLLLNKSFSEISLTQIAKETNITKGTIYYYYSSKSDLLYDVADLYLSQLYEDLLSWVDNPNKDTSLPRLLKYSLLRGIDEPEKALRLHLVMDAVGGNNEIRTKLLNKYTEFKRIFSEKIGERNTNCTDENNEYLGWLLLTIIDGAIIQDLLGNTNINKELFVDKTVKLIEAYCD